MSSKVPLATLAAVAKSQGYNGDPGDAAKIKTYLLTHPDGAVEVIEYEGEEFQIKDLEFAAPKSPRKVKAEKIDDAIQHNGSLPPDWEEKAKALAKDMLAKAGFVEDKIKGKFRFIDPEKTQVTSVKSGEQVAYEHRIKSGHAMWDNYESARWFAGHVRSKALRALGRHDKADAIVKAQHEEMSQKGYTLVQESTGAALAPEGYDANVIRLIKDYGVARKICRIVPMTTDVYSRPKVTSAPTGLTVNYPQDGTAGTETSETWGRVTLKAKQGVVIVKMSRAVLDDAAINLIEDQTREVARAIAKCEDNTLFNGTGGNQSGFIPSVQGLTVQVTDTSTNSRTLKDGGTSPGAASSSSLSLTMGLCPQFARSANTAWHMTPEMWNFLMTRLGQAQGGATFKEFQEFGDVPMLLGRPVIFNNVMPSANTTSANRINAIFGDMSLAADFGDRKGVEIDISDQRYWDEVNIGLRAVVRHDINVHDVGSTTTQSPVVFLTQT